MEIYIYLIPITILIALVGLIALFWSISTDQYQDLQNKSQKILFIKERD
jgi:cbb3-type cytochrome oxidase maturation protein